MQLLRRSLRFAQLLLALHCRFLLQQRRLLFTGVLHLVSSFLRYSQSALHGSLHLLIIFQLGADALDSFLLLQVIQIKVFVFLNQLGKKLVYLFYLIATKTLGKSFFFKSSGLSMVYPPRYNASALR